MIKNYVFDIESEADLVDTFRTKEQRRIVLPTEQRFPVRIPYYYAWSESSGVYSYLVYKKPNWGSPRGILFKRPRGRADNGRICDWCLSVGPADRIGMMTIELNSRESMALMVCTDLRCIHRLQEAALLSGKDFDKLAQNLMEKIGKLYEFVFSSREPVEESLETSH